MRGLKSRMLKFYSITKNPILTKTHFIKSRWSLPFESFVLEDPDYSSSSSSSLSPSMLPIILRALGPAFSMTNSFTPIRARVSIPLTNQRHALPWPSPGRTPWPRPDSRQWPPWRPRSSPPPGCPPGPGSWCHNIFRFFKSGGTFCTKL